MDIERIVGTEVDTCEGLTIGEIVGVEIIGTKIRLIMSCDFFLTVDDPDGGEEVPVDNVETLKLVEPLPETG